MNFYLRKYVYNFLLEEHVFLTALRVLGVLYHNTVIAYTMEYSITNYRSPTSTGACLCQMQVVQHAWKVSVAPALNISDIAVREDCIVYTI